VNTKAGNKLPAWLPFVVGFLFVALFASLGAWQISRGLEKRADQQMFEDETGFSAWHDGMPVRPYQRLRVTGRYDGDHQVLLENMIVNGRYGYYVITPLFGMDGEPVLLINRGWIPKGAIEDLPDLEVPAGSITVRGRVGHLPRAGMKMGDAFVAGQAWPKMAVYPSADEVSAELGRDVQPFVLLMDRDEEYGFVRTWAPTGFGPGKHFGYALQWFAMGLVLSVLLIWNYRKKRFN
jgi:surfeit locus 1 family protein